MHMIYIDVFRKTPPYVLMFKYVFSVKIYKSDGVEPLQELWQILTCVGMRMGPALRTDPGYTNNGCWSPGS